MVRPTIELYLQPPSPGLPPEEQCVLPSVSTLLRDIPSSPPLQACSYPPSPQHCPTLKVDIPYMYSPCTSPSLSPLSSPSLSPRSHLLLPPPCNTRRSRSLSNTSTTSSFSSVSTLPSTPLPSSPSPTHRRLSDPPLYSNFDLPPCSWQPASPSLSTSSSSINTTCDTHSVSTDDPTPPKRKRGRPPNATTQRDNWTFVTPTVWDVKQPQQRLGDDLCMMVLLWPDGDMDPNQTSATAGEQQMNRVFTSTKMDSTLSIPRKKRGRKPKTQLAGNSCFVWRDLTARRGTFKPSPSPKPPAQLKKATAADLVEQVKSLKL